MAFNNISSPSSKALELGRETLVGTGISNRAGLPLGLDLNPSVLQGIEAVGGPFLAVGAYRLAQHQGSAAVPLLVAPLLGAAAGYALVDGITGLTHGGVTSPVAGLRGAAIEGAAALAAGYYAAKAGSQGWLVAGGILGAATAYNVISAFSS